MESNEFTTVKVRKSTVKLLKEIAHIRKRRETQEQVILELVERYLKDNDVR